MPHLGVLIRVSLVLGVSAVSFSTTFQRRSRRDRRVSPKRELKLGDYPSFVRLDDETSTLIASSMISRKRAEKASGELSSLTRLSAA